MIIDNLFVVSQDKELLQYLGNNKSITFPKEIRKIGKDVFNNATYLEEVDIPSNVKEIGESAFANCANLKKLIFQTGIKVIGKRAFYNCSKLENIPNFDVDKITNMYCAFISCYRVKTGILSLYQRASTQTNPPSNHYGTFRNCGRDTTQGAAELAQIPSDWK